MTGNEHSITVNATVFFLLLQVWASLLLYRQILDEIEANDYNNFTRRAYVSKPKKVLALPVAYAKSLVSPSRMSSLIQA